jgi:hypothetical protein
MPGELPSPSGSPHLHYHRHLGDVPAPTEAVVGEHDLLCGDALGCPQGAGRALHQQAQISEARIDQPRAEPVPPMSAAPR